MLELKAADVEKLTSEDLRDCSAIWLLDSEELSPSQIEQVRLHIKALATIPPNHTLNLELIDRKLSEIKPLIDENFLSTPRITNDTETNNLNVPSDEVSTPGLDEYIEKMRSEVFSDLIELQQLGGKPSAPVKEDPGPWQPGTCDEHLHLSSHWTSICCRTSEELARWQWFRCFQIWKRQIIGRFREYVTALQSHIKAHDLKWDMSSLDHDLSKQTMLQCWKEYYLYEHRAFILDRQYNAEGVKGIPWKWYRFGLGQYANWMEFSHVSSRLRERDATLCWVRNYIKQLSTADDTGDKLRTTSNRHINNTAQSVGKKRGRRRHPVHGIKCTPFESQLLDHIPAITWTRFNEIYTHDKTPSRKRKAEDDNRPNALLKDTLKSNYSHGRSSPDAPATDANDLGALDCQPHWKKPRLPSHGAKRVREYKEICDPERSLTQGLRRSARIRDRALKPGAT